MTLVNWQYCNDPNDINEAIKTKDEDWEGLTSADDIISITYDHNHGCYVVFWTMERNYKEKQTEEKTDKSNLCADCETCRFADLTAHEFPCSACSASHTFRWEARKGASE